MPAHFAKTPRAYTEYGFEKTVCVVYGKNFPYIGNTPAQDSKEEMMARYRTEKMPGFFSSADPVYSQRISHAVFAIFAMNMFRKSTGTIDLNTAATSSLTSSVT
jgi:hypothetical protein